MAGFFGLFDYTKEGPGIEKDAPKKKTFIVFFETFFRNIWKLMTVNAVYILMSILIIPSGLANVGITNVTRNLARDKHSFMLSDFFETIKKNFKQGLIVGILNALIFGLMFFATRFYWSNTGTAAVLGLGVCLAGLFIFVVMNFYIYTLIITFNYSIKQLYTNSFKFVFICFKNNIICLFSLILVYAVNLAILLLIPSVQFQILLIELLVAFLTFPGFRFLMIQYAVFPGIKKYIIDPYYKEHPGEDIEKRKSLGLDVEEEFNDDDEDDDEGSDEEEPEIESKDESETEGEESDTESQE